MIDCSAQITKIIPSIRMIVWLLYQYKSNLSNLFYAQKPFEPSLVTMARGALRDGFGYFCRRALTRQLPILYNREKKAKSVGCKIGDLRSKVAFNIRGLLNVETCAVDYGCL